MSTVLTSARVRMGLPAGMVDVKTLMNVTLKYHIVMKMHCVQMSLVILSVDVRGDIQEMVKHA
jgi:hypothetical protein